MNKTIYRQTNSKWSKLPYPTKASSFGGNGCGACAVLHTIMERPKYWDWTPKDIQPYMKTLAVEGNGTLWAGIKEALEHFGMKNVKRFDSAAKISDVWKELNKKNRLGVLLMEGSYGGIIWTISRHYVCFKKYKVENGKHYFYIIDSGDRHNDGWFCYETQMKGCIFEITTCTLPKDYQDWILFYAKKYSHSKDVKQSKWEYKTGSPVSAYKKALEKYCGKTKKVDQSDCGWFVNTVVRAAGVDNDYKVIAGASDPFPSSKKMKVVHRGSKFPNSKRKPGQIIRYKKNNGSQHTLILTNNGYIAEAGREIRFPRRIKSTKYNNSSVNLKTLEVLEPKEG